MGPNVDSSVCLLRPKYVEPCVRWQSAQKKKNNKRIKFKHHLQASHHFDLLNFILGSLIQFCEKHQYETRKNICCLFKFVR